MVIQTSGIFNKIINLYAKSELEDFFHKYHKRKERKKINLSNGKKEVRVYYQSDWEEQSTHDSTNRTKS